MTSLRLQHVILAAERSAVTFGLWQLFRFFPLAKQPRSDRRARVEDLCEKAAHVCKKIAAIVKSHK
jgi:hypothetical protein